MHEVNLHFWLIPLESPHLKTETWDVHVSALGHFIIMTNLILKVSQSYFKYGQIKSFYYYKRILKYGNVWLYVVY